MNTSMKIHALLWLLSICQVPTVVAVDLLDVEAWLMHLSRVQMLVVSRD